MSDEHDYHPERNRVKRVIVTYKPIERGSYWPMVLTLFTASFCHGCLYMDMHPGWIESSVCIAVCMLMLAIPFVCVIAYCYFPAEVRLRNVRYPTLIFAITGLLYLFDVPKLVSLAASRAELEQIALSSPNDSQERGLGTVGMITIDQYARDPRGGVYFRITCTTPYSYGYAFRPNLQGSPYGSEQYRLKHLFGDWYEFSASQGSF